MKTLLPFDKGWDGFYNFDIGQLAQKFTTFPPEFFEKQGRGTALALFHQMTERVPAYQNFLKKNKITPKKIKKFEDLQNIPWIDKRNYLKQYPLPDLCWDGEVKAPIISASSGSSGQASFWPRSTNTEIETTYIYELFLKHFFNIDKYPTLLICGFSMGIYVGGTFTLNCCMRLAQKGYPLTIVTPGVNQKEILEVLERLGPHFEQIILGGYPPFLRDILDEAERRGIKLKKKKLKLFFASESLSEKLRKYIYDKAGVKDSDYLSSSMNLYGTADAAIAGHESPLSIFVRQLFSGDSKRCKEFFGTSYVPSLNLYYPFLKFMQIEKEEILFSAPNNEIPLLRYNIHDRGNIIPFMEMLEIAKSFGYSKKDLEKIIGKPLLWRLPHVYLYGRSDFTVTIYGLNVYPEHIKAALETDGLKDLTTGKFVMETKNRKKDQSQYLLVHIEMGGGIKPTKALEKKCQKTIVKTLKKVNLEYNHLHQAIKTKADPEIDLCERGNKKYFSAATKQKWSVR